MVLPAEWKSKTSAELEDWYLAALAHTPLPIAPMIEVLGHLPSIGRTDIAQEWSQLLLDGVVALGDGDSALTVLEMQVAWNAGDPDFGKAACAALQLTFKDRPALAFVKAAGFESGLAPAEALRRFRVLYTLRPGTLCYEKTWGFGVIKHLDEFFQKVIVDFRHKPGHQMSFAYASETLKLIDETHIEARFHHDSAGLLALVKSDPAEAVRIVLRSYGPQSAPDIKDRLVDGGMLKDEEWKAFWDTARKALKADPSVDIPAKRNDPVRLRDKARAYDDDWFAALRGERDMERILALARELEVQPEAKSLSAAGRAALSDRLAFVLLGARGTRPDLQASGVVAADRFGLAPAEVARLEATESALWQPALFLSATAEARARDAEGLVRLLWKRDNARAQTLLFEVLASLKYSVLNFTIGYLGECGQVQACAARLRELAEERTFSAALLAWLTAHLAFVREHGVMPIADVLNASVDCLELPLAGEWLRSQNQLRETLEKKEWLADALDSLEPVQRQIFLGRVADARGWDSTGRRSMLAKLIILYPELQKAVVGEDPEAKRAAQFTSWRTYRERQLQYRELVEKTIPANSRDIAHARSYGDLRENFEYQTAKDTQRMLLQRQQDMQMELRNVKGTDFSGVPADKVGMGTMVTLQRPDGRQEPYVILGEWDRDEGLSIISNESRVAKVLEGKTAGDEVILPGAAGDETCRVVSVAGLNDAVKAWIGHAG